MSDSSNPNFDSAAFVSGFIGENADGSSDYLFGRFTRWYFAQRPGNAQEEPTVDELAEQRLLRQIAQNHAAKADTAEPDTSPARTSRTPRMAIAASVAVAALGLALFMASPRSPLDHPESLRGHAPEQAVIAGTINDLDAAKKAIRTLGKNAEVGQTLKLDSIVDPFAPEFASIDSTFGDGETIYFLRVTIDKASDLDALESIAGPGSPFAGLGNAVSQQQKNLVVVDGSSQVLIYLFRLKR